MHAFKAINSNVLWRTQLGIRGNFNQANPGMESKAKVSAFPNRINIDVGRDGHISASVVEEEPPTTKGQSPAKKQRKSDNGPPLSPTDVSSIPESVLQYERQLRKVQANQRSLTALTKEKHLKIIHEDEKLIVTNKPSGVLCVPGLHNKPNLLKLVCDHLDLEEVKSNMIVHRLDMDTCGLVVFSKNESTLKNLQASFRDRSVQKTYHALLCGHIPIDWKRGDIYLPLQRDHRHPPFMRIATPRSETEANQAVKDLQTHGFKKLIKKKPKPSHTAFEVVQREFLSFPSEEAPGHEDKIPVTRVSLIPHTGRTHQLRVHCAALGYPIVGDPAYGLYGEAQANGGLDIISESGDLGASLKLQKKLNELRPTHTNPMCLHAAELSFRHPSTTETISLSAPTPF